jgi:serine/threonine-protein kinase RsbW
MSADQAIKRTGSFPHDPRSVPAARRFAAHALAGASADTIEAVELMVSELATNCIRHTDSGFELTIARAGRTIRVEATDGAGGNPTMRSPKPTDPTGRGLKIVDMLSSGWGVERRQRQGKTVWFTIAEAEPAPAGRACRVGIPTAYVGERRAGPRSDYADAGAPADAESIGSPSTRRANARVIPVVSRSRGMRPHTRAGTRSACRTVQSEAV